MGATDSFRQHHRDILRTAAEISRLLRADAVKKDPAAVRALVSRFAGKLSIHLSMEDASLYPSLLKHRDASVRSIADLFIKEMGGVKNVFASYARKWSTLEDIRTNPAGFVTDTKCLFAALSKRIEKEDTELYALVDRMKAAA